MASPRPGSRVRAAASLAALVVVASSAASARADVPAGAPATVAPPEPPLAGFHGGSFFLRDRDDVFRLYVQGRVHVDALAWFGPGVASLGADSALKSTFFLRRARAEIGGEFFEQWQWQLSGDFGPTSTDNPAARGATRTCAVDATGALACSDTSAAVETGTQRTIPTDAFVNFAPSTWFNVQVGQFLIPFTLENPVSDNTQPFLERSIVSRNLGTPLTRDIGAMIWGEHPAHLVYYTVGVYNGDGPNRTNADSRFDLVARSFARPFRAVDRSPLRDAQVGLSVRYGSRDPKQVGYDVAPMTTQGGYAFWRPTYKDSVGRTIHVIPSAEQGAVGADLYVPIDGFDFTGEIVYAHTSTREAADGYQLSPFTQRVGTLKGYAYYLEAGYWVFGSRDIIGLPSYGKPKHVDLKAPVAAPLRGLQALAKVERLHVSYAGASRGGALDAETPDGDIDVTALALGLNYWATRHLRVGLNGSAYFFPGSAPVSASAPGGPTQSATQRAVAPAQALPRGVDDSARDSGHTVYEVQARMGVQF